MCLITSSIVVYKNKTEVLQRAIDSFLDTDLDIKLYIIDNSPSSGIENIYKDKRVECVFSNKNLGFGAGHNVAIRKSRDKSKYHLILNPDIFFERGVIEEIYNFMEANGDVGLIMPKVCYFDDSVQYLCKLLPTPFDFFLRRSNFKVLKTIFKNRLDNYEFKFTGYDKIMDVPHLSGCFMFVRRDVFRKVGIFDERFFMYLEDVDFSRRIHAHYKTLYYPQVSIYHQCAMDSHSNLAAFTYHVFSAIKYFNKWGWFFDKERKRMNKEALRKILT